MPNHWHLVPWPAAAGELSRFMHWLTNAHVRRSRRHRHSDGQGHVYQVWLKAFPVEEDLHYLTLLRYMEANPPRAGLVGRVEGWTWSSLTRPTRESGAELSVSGRWSRPGGWLETVNEPLTDAAGRT